MNDFRFAFRSLGKSPGFTAAAVLTLALGIGANTAIFSVFDRALLRTLPVPEPDQLVRVVTERGAGNINHNLGYRTYTVLRDDSPVFAGVAAHVAQPLALRTEAGVERIEGAAVSSGFFQTLGVEPAMGRWFVPEEEIVGTPVPVIVLSHGLWRRRFGLDPAIVGSQIMLNERQFTVIGVAPRSFTGLVLGGVQEAWIPVTMVPELGGDVQWFTSPRVSWLDVVARMRPGLTAAQAESALAGLDRQLVDDGLGVQGERTRLLDGSQGLTFRVSGVTRPLRLLLGVVGALLLVAAANIANLLLARATTRRREVAIRLALGASRGRLVGQLLAESLVLAVLGGALGLVVAAWTSDVLLAFRPPGEPALQLGADLDVRVLVFAALLSIGTGVLFGLVPALRASRSDVVPALKEEPGGTGTRDRRFGMREGLVVVQVAASLVLLTGAGLFLRSLGNLQGIDPGFVSEGVILASLDLDPRGYDAERTVQFYEHLLDRLQAAPGVEAVSLTQTVTPNPGGSRWDGVFLDGYTAAEVVGFDANDVAPGYFEALRIPLLRGRAFDRTDRRGAPRVAVINQTMAERYWPGQDPVGRRIRLDTTASTPVFEIVGVAADGKYRDLREAPANNVYYAALQSFRPQMTLVVRGPAPPADLIASARTAVGEIDPGLPLFDVTTLDEHLRSVTSPERMLASLVSAFGLLALLLASVGVYGVVAFVIGRQTREIGLRVALGARPHEVVLLFLRRGGRLIGAGGLIGIAAALALAPRASGLLYGVGPREPLVLLGAAGVLAGVALIATYLPARRAARVDPMVALRYE
ncbi:MAG: ABC transporter permease [Gemmatimonadetes bacterium]|nr:ABC transporter permease [Gemmatimonadota bacterium]